MNRTFKEELSEQPLGNAWDILERMAGTVYAPSDWASEHDHHLYGTPKRNEKNGANPERSNHPKESVDLVSDSPLLDDDFSSNLKPRSLTDGEKIV